MKINMNFTAVVELCKDTGLYVGYVSGFMGAHSQGKTLDELDKNLQEVIAMLLEDEKTQNYHEYSPKNNVRKNVVIDTTHNIMS